MKKSYIKWIVLMVLLMISVACATPNTTRVKVTNKADNTETKITVTNGDGGSSSITVSPKVKMDSIKVL